MSTPLPLEAAELSAQRMKATVGALAARELAGRRVATSGGAAAREILIASLAELDSAGDVDHFETPLGSAANIYATITEAVPGGLEVMLTGHYDGAGDVDGIHRPGAADNASGVAVVLEAARLLKDQMPEGVGLTVALLDGEEVGASAQPITLRACSPRDNRPWSSTSTALGS